MHLAMKKLQLSASMLSAALLASSCVALDESQDIATSQSENDIVGGLPTSITLNPWQVLIYAKIPNTNMANQCGGSVLSKDWILTAQHCTVGKTADLFDVHAGTSTASNAGQARKVAEIVNVPGYLNAQVGKDVALLRLATPLTIDNITVRPIAMLMPSQVGLAADGTAARVTGWGHLMSGGQSPDTLQTVDINLVSLDSARAIYGMPLSDDQIAAHGKNKGSCQGDSGGPLTIDGPNGRLLVGVVSWAKGCAFENYPTLYGRVSSYYDWVKSVTGISDPVNPPSDPGTGGGGGGGNTGGEDDGSLDGSANESSAVQGGCNAGAMGAAGGGELVLVIATFLGLRRRNKTQS
jgi:secreted trypsin-like serine protease